MEVPISQFRRNLFSLIETALDGKDVWVRHKGRRLRLVPEDQPGDKLSRITPLEIIVDDARISDDSWKDSMKKDWERKWDHKLGPRRKPSHEVSSPAQVKSRKAKRPA